MDAVGALKQVFIFRDVPDAVLQVVAKAAEEISVPAGETFISPGDSPNALFVIRSGTVRLLSGEGKTPPVLFGTGETIGEVPLIDGGPVGGTATALERADLVILRAGRLAEVLAGNPDAGMQLYRAIARSLAGRLRRAVGMIAFAKARDNT
jgi:lysophospholipid hydrolase